MREQENTAIILNDTYYLDNFRKLLDFVSVKYEDLLNDQEKKFISQFHSLSQDAQCLYVRLMSRKGPYFRTDKLAYKEIKNIPKAINELVALFFFERNPLHDIEFVLNTFTKPELEELIKMNSEVLNKDALRFSRKAEILDHLLVIDKESLFDIFYTDFEIVFPLYFEFISVFKLLFFGNTYNDLTEFILEDIGMMKFEKYEIRDEDRYFTERKLVDDTFILSQIRTELLLTIQSNDLEGVLHIGELIKSYDFHEKLNPKVQKSFTEIGRFIEKFKLWNEALNYYKLTEYPPAMERKVRVHDKLGDYKAALKTCEHIIDIGENEEEIEFAQKFSETLKKKLQLPYEKRKLEKFNTLTLEIEIDKSVRIEELILNYFINQGYSGFYSENGIWKALFALLFWDIMFMPLPEVFFNPYQRGPADLFTNEFRIKRAEQFTDRFKELESSDLIEYTLKMYEIKFNTANALISWKYIQKEQLVLLLNMVPKDHVLAICQRMSSNLKDMKTGFPDLMIFDEKDTSYFAAEVKGPGDQLRPNQKRWLRYFETKGIPYKVVQVKSK
jgi:hypothetical protein